MKSLDIRSESAVKLLSEFLDMDQPYVEGQSHPNAEHFAHGMFFFLICCYLLLLIFLLPFRSILVSTVSLS